jgi:hypothetical protein
MELENSSHQLDFFSELGKDLYYTIFEVEYLT